MAQREGAIGPAGVAAVGRAFDAAQEGHRGRFGEERAVGVPAAAEQRCRPGVGFLDDRVNLAVARDALRIGIDREGPEPGGEALMLGVGEVLPTQVEHLVVVERLLEVLEPFVRQVRQAHADDFGAHGAGQRTGLEMARFERGVVEFPARRDADFPHGSGLLSGPL